MRRLASVLAVLLIGCGGEDAPRDDVRAILGIPDGFATPAIPAANPPSAEKIELGRALFFDRNLSANRSQACVDCHQQENAFADLRTTPVGSTGDALPRNSMSLLNVAYAPTLTWAARSLVTIEDQLHIPLTNDAPIELGITDGARAEVLERFAADATYATLFAKAFPELQSITLDAVRFALASFCRTLYSTPSAYDRYTAGDVNALTDEQKHGAELFFGERFECFHCHTGAHLTVAYADAEQSSPAFFNNGLYDVDGEGSYPATDQGLYDLTFDAFDRGRFRPPSLRNVARTAPYMHDGSLTTLEEVVAHYARGGAGSPLQSSLVRPIPDATETDIASIVAFLAALSDD